MIQLTEKTRDITLSDYIVRWPSAGARAVSGATTGQLLSEARRVLEVSIPFRDGDPLKMRLIGSGQEPSWHWRALQALKDIAALERDWDSYGAQPVSAAAVRRCILQLFNVLPERAADPEIVPTRDGGLQLEWHRGAMDFEITVPPAGPISYLFADDVTGEELEWEGPPNLHERQIGVAMERLTQAP